MKLKYQEKTAWRSGRSTVYSFTCDIAGRQIEEDGAPKIFSIQIEDDYDDKSGAMQAYLDKIEDRYGQAPIAPPSMDEILGRKK